MTENPEEKTFHYVFRFIDGRLEAASIPEYMKQYDPSNANFDLHEHLLSLGFSEFMTSPDADDYNNYYIVFAPTNTEKTDGAHSFVLDCCMGGVYYTVLVYTPIEVLDFINKYMQPAMLVSTLVSFYEIMADFTYTISNLLPENKRELRKLLEETS